MGQGNGFKIFQVFIRYIARLLLIKAEKHPS